MVSSTVRVSLGHLLGVLLAVWAAAIAAVAIEELRWRLVVR